MLVPEIIINNVINSILEVVNDDWNANSNKTKTILYGIFNKDDNNDIMKVGKFIYYEQAQDILLKTANDPRKIQVTMGYNLERAPMPTIHIILPSENKGENSIGFNEGFGEYEYNEAAETYKRKYSYASQATYNLLVTSANSSEAILIYHFLKYAMISLKDHIENSGLQNISFGGNDLNFQGDLVPPNVFHRGLLFSFTYYNEINKLFAEKFIKGITFLGHPLQN